MTYQTLLLWGAFNLFVIAMLALDLGVFHRKAHEIRIREALFWSVFWIVLSMLFNLGVYYWHGSQAALEFLTGYLLEKSLSVDNIFVFLMIFTYFRVPYLHQHKVLFWGILGALIMRALFILVGMTLIQRFHWVIYIMGAFLIITGIKMATQKDADIHPERNPVLRLIRRLVRVTEDYEGDAVLCEAQRAAAGHAALHRRAGGRDDRRDLRGGFDSSDPRRSRSTPSSSTPRTSLRSWGCGRCISPWPGSCNSSTIYPMACRSSWCSWGSKCCWSISTKFRSASRWGRSPLCW